MPPTSSCRPVLTDESWSSNEVETENHTEVHLGELVYTGKFAKGRKQSGPRWNGNWVWTGTSRWDSRTVSKNTMPTTGGITVTFSWLTARRTNYVMPNPVVLASAEMEVGSTYTSAKQRSQMGVYPLDDMSDSRKTSSCQRWTRNPDLH